MLALDHVSSACRADWSDTGLGNECVHSSRNRIREKFDKTAMISSSHHSNLILPRYRSMVWKQVILSGEAIVRKLSRQVFKLLG